MEILPSGAVRRRLNGWAEPRCPASQRPRYGVGRVPGHDEVVQTADGADVAVIAATDVDSRGTELQAGLARAGLDDPVVSLRRQDALPRTKLGKRRLFVPMHAGVFAT